MSENKRFYWLKLRKDFFKRADIRIIESMPNGKDYILFYLKLLLESVSHSGELRFSDAIPYNEEMLSTVTDTNIDIVRSAMKIFTELEMIEILDDKTIFMAEVEKMIGSADQDEHTRESTRNRVRAFRERQKQVQTDEKRYSNAKCNGEKDIDKDSEKDTETEPNKESDTEPVRKANIDSDKSPDAEIIKSVIDFLNQICSTHYKSSTPKTRTLIRARLKEGFTLDDFKTVIEKKYSQWNGTKMQPYLRPETLLGTKFEGYLNETDGPISGSMQGDRKYCSGYDWDSI